MITQRLEQHHAESFRVAAFVDDRRQYQHARVVQGAMQVRLRDAPRHAHAPVQSELTYLAFEFGAIGALAQDQQFRGNRSR